MESSLLVTAQKSQNLLDDVREFLQTSESDEMRNLAKTVPSKAIPEDKPLTIVFAGQYSAGKSSILKILTGNDLAVGEGIVTEKTTEMNWNGLTVIDTPGIKTGIRKDHDAITYDAIAKADLVVYVITESLFTPETSENFRNLAFGCDKKNEMMLVINKMNNLGNTEEIRNIKTNSIMSDLAPAKPEDFFLTFVSAESWFDAQETDNARRKEKKLAEANISDLEDKLKLFTQQRNLHAKFTTSLYSLDHQLDLALGVEPLVDKDASAVREVLRREKMLIARAKRDIESQAEAQINNLVGFIRSKGCELANYLEECKSENDFADKQAEIGRNINDYAVQITAEIENIVKTELEQLEKENAELLNSDFVKKVIKNLEIRYEQYNPLVSDNTKKVISHAGGYSEKFGQWLSTCCKGNGASGLSSFSGSSAHGIVLKVGKLIGHKFKPWEAVKYVKVASNVAKGFAIVGMVVSVALQAKETHDEIKMQKALQKNRDEVRKVYIEAADKMKNDYIKAVSQMLEEQLDPALKDINGKMDQLDTMEQNYSESRKKLLEFRQQTRDLLLEIHNSKVEVC